jgi:putative endonuclease
MPAKAGIHFRRFRTLREMDSRFRGNDDTWCHGLMATKHPAVYIMASRERGTLYVGVTGWLRERIHEHREGLHDGFSKKYRIVLLAWFELHPDFPSAIRRETQLKKWNRAWKLELIESSNPSWRDLFPDILE